MLNTDNSTYGDEFHTEAYPVGGSPRRLKVAMIGAGFSGIIAGIRAQQYLPYADFTIFEKNSSVGGTWFENSYPGLCCDIPAHCYSLTFEPNPYWSTFYAQGPEILAYLRRVAEKYKLDQYIKYRHTLVKAEWDEASALWTLTFDLTDEQGKVTGQITETANVVLQGMGGLSRWDWPDIEGIESYQGRLLHSAAYLNKAEDETDRSVAVIGSGSSAIQIVPSLQPFVKHVDNYVRGSTWIAAPFASNELLKRRKDGRNYTFTEEEKVGFARDSLAYHDFRHRMESELNNVHSVTQRGSEMQLGAVRAFADLMNQKLAAKPEIAKKLIPTFPVACRRLTPGPGYLESLVESNVGFIPDAIKRITPTGIETADGTHRDYDTIVCATGFDTSYRPRIPIIGRNGTNVQDLWSDIPTHYLSVSIGPDFPNFFMVNGPNSTLGSGSLLVLFEREVEYIVKIIEKMQRENLRTVSPKQGPVDDWMEYTQSYFKKTVYSEKCRSWYKMGREEGPVVALWPGSCLHGIQILKQPRWEDFDYTLDGQRNRFSWAGNGAHPAELDPEGDRAFYLNEIDYPPVPQ